MRQITEHLGPAADEVIATWRAFALHARSCQADGSCERARLLAVRQYDFGFIHAEACAEGRELLEAWHAAVETCAEVGRELGREVVP